MHKYCEKIEFYTGSGKIMEGLLTVKRKMSYSFFSKKKKRKYFYCTFCGVHKKNEEDYCWFSGVLHEVEDNISKMSPSEKKAYQRALKEFEKQVKKTTGKKILTHEDYLKFWENYGLADTRPPVKNITHLDFL